MDQYLFAGESICEINEDLRLIQKDGGLKFGTDSYLLSAFIKKNLHCSAVDLGAGCGVVSLFAAARCSFTDIHAVEIQDEFAKLVDRNAALNDLGGIIRSHHADVRELKDHFIAESAGAVFSNPPYMRCESGKNSKTDEMNTARREENGTIEDFCRAASYLLKFGGLFWTVYRPDRCAELIYSLKSNSLEPKRMITVYPDRASAPCLILTESKKGAAPSLKMARPLIIYSGAKDDTNRKYTEDMDRVYRDFSLDFLFE